MHITKIADLSQCEKGVYNISIKVAVSLKSIEHYNNRINYFCMDLRDDSGEISAVAFEDACAALHPCMRPNKIYVITRFKIGYSDRRYTSVQHEKQIVLLDDTVVDFCGKAAKIEWPPVFKRRKRSFYNIIAVCTDVEDTTVAHSGKLTRKVALRDESGDEIILHVWNRETLMFDYVNLASYPVLFVKDARIFGSDDDEGEFVVTTTRFLQFLDSNDHRARRVREAVQYYQSDESSDDYYSDSS